MSYDKIRYAHLYQLVSCFNLLQQIVSLQNLTEQIETYLQSSLLPAAPSSVPPSSSSSSLSADIFDLSSNNQSVLIVTINYKRRKRELVGKW